METETGTHSAPQARHNPTGMYIAVGISSLVLTGIAFFLIAQDSFLKPYLIPIILVLAAVQVGLQTILFMHLNSGRRMYSLFFGYGAFMAVVAVVGLGIVMSATEPGPKVVHLTPAQLLAEGQKIVSTQCVSCHTVNGSGGKIGPDLNQVIAGKVNLVPGGQPTNAAWLQRWIADPQGVWSGAVMPNLGLSPNQVQAVVQYLQLKVK